MQKYMELSGMVKKAISMLGIIHDRSKINGGSLEEFRSAISHTKESKSSINPATYIINPVEVLSLFRRMSDEVYLYGQFNLLFFFEVLNGIISHIHF